MKDTLSIIQMFSKIARIVSKVLMVVGIVAAALCVLGIISLAIGFVEPLTLFGIDVYGIIENAAGVAVSDLYISLATGIIMCIATALNAGFTTKYFENELDAGTPFTLDGAKEMLRLGILIMAISLGATVIAAITEEIMNFAMGSDYSTELDIGGTFSMGLMFLAMSFVCKHGAELSEKKEITE